MTLEELQEDYKKNNMNRVRFLRTLYGLPLHEVKRLLEIETPEERGMLRCMTTSESHVAKIIDLLANVRDHRWLPVAWFLQGEERAQAGSMTRVAIRWIALFGFILFVWFSLANLESRRGK